MGKNLKTILSTIAIIFISSMSSYANGIQDATSQLYFEVLSNGTASITYSTSAIPTNNGENYSNLPEELIIPNEVSDGTNTYIVSEIGENAFQFCSAVHSVKFNTTALTKISNFAFRQLTNLKNMILPSTVQEFHKHAFYSSPITFFQWIPQSVVDDYTFEIFTRSIKNFVLGNAIKSINMDSFIGICNDRILENIILLSENEVPALTPNNITTNCSNVTLHVKSGMKAIFESDATWAALGFKEILEDADSYVVETDDNTGEDQTGDNLILVDSDYGTMSLKYPTDQDCIITVKRDIQTENDKIRQISLVDTSGNLIQTYTSDNIPEDGKINLGKLTSPVTVYVSWDTLVWEKTVLADDLNNQISVFAHDGQIVVLSESLVPQLITIYSADGTKVITSRYTNSYRTTIPVDRGQMVIVQVGNNSCKLML
jgi:hypothetical protein